MGVVITFAPMYLYFPDIRFSYFFISIHSNNTSDTLPTDMSVTVFQEFQASSKRDTSSARRRLT